MDETAKAPVAPSAQKIVGGFAANDAALNASGAFVVKQYGGIDMLCSAVLITDNMVLTSKSCAEAVGWGWGSDVRISFTIGPNIFGPQREVEVVEHEEISSNQDLGVLHLGEHITDVTPLSWAQLDDEALDKAFIAIGYGEQDTYNSNAGIRKLGTITLRARAGRTYEYLYGSFAGYFESYTGQPLPSYCLDEDDAGVAWPVVTGGVGGRGGAGGKGGCGGGSGKGGCGGGSGKGGCGGGGGKGGCGGGGDYLCQWAQQLFDQYNRERLETLSEVAAGGAPGDSQPCYRDVGGPLLRKGPDGKLTVYGVLSSGRSGCDHGAIYAAFDQTALDFLAKAKSWVDPCAGLTSVGRCTGTLAERCTNRVEGKRRRVAFDCASVDLTCETQNDGSIGCGTDSTYFGSAPAFTPLEPLDPRSVSLKAFGQP